jgi:hypothetical protein
MSSLQYGNLGKKIALASSSFGKGNLETSGFNLQLSAMLGSLSSQGSLEMGLASFGSLSPSSQGIQGSLEMGCASFGSLSPSSQGSQGSLETDLLSAILGSLGFEGSRDSSLNLGVKIGHEKNVKGQ